jgi:hypothetical protein
METATARIEARTLALSFDFTSQDYLRDPAAGIDRLRSADRSCKFAFR